MTIGSSKALLQLNKLYAIKVLNNRVMVIVFSMTIIVLVKTTLKSWNFIRINLSHCIK